MGFILSGIDQITDSIRGELDVLDEVREQAFRLSREIIRSSSVTIKHMHRAEIDLARRQLSATADLVRQMQEAVARAPQIGGGGFVGDAEKEYVEAALVIACISGETLVSHQDLGVSGAVWLNGLAEVVGELRRHVLDLIRLGDPERAEQYLTAMDDIYQTIVAFDYPDAISLGLRRRADAARGMVERTRGDLTNALRQASLERRLAEFEKRL
ncbi:MAG: haloacid dehalogenase [candidate division WS1 bacterium]|mgnify:CR=1 FL=1|nr:haloacid dehalogenase [candidate division WS1 bacterium]